MAIRTSKSQSFKIAFVLDESLLRSITNLLQEVSQEIEYHVGCSDGSSIQCTSLEEVLQVPNSKERQITYIVLITPLGKAPSIRLRFRGRPFDDSIEYEVSGDEKSTFFVSDKLDECISNLRQWYTPVAFLSFLELLLLFFLGILIGSVAVVVFYTANTPVILDLSEPIVEDKTDGDRFLLRLFLQIMGIFILSAAIKFLFERIFPIATFAIGGGLKRYKGLVIIRHALGVGFGLALLASLIASWLL